MGWYNKLKKNQREAENKFIVDNFSKTLNSLEKELGEGNPDIKQFAKAIANLVHSEYGSNNFKNFLISFESELDKYL